MKDGEALRADSDPGMTRAPGSSAALVPDWLVNLAALGWRVLAIAGLVVVLWLVATLLWTVTASIAVAIVISAVFAPFVLRLRGRGRSRNAAAGIVWVAAIVTVTVILLVLAFAFLPYAVDMAAEINAGLANLQARLAELQVPAWVGTVVRDAFEFVRSTAGHAAGGIVASAAGVVTVLILATFLIFFFLRDGDRAWVWMFQAVGDQKRDRITAAGHVALSRVGGYLRGTTVLAGLVAVTDFAFLWLLGVPLALPLSVLAFLSGYIPYFGGFVATAIILVVTLGSLGAGPALVLLVLIGVRNVILAYLVRPAVYGRTVAIHPALVLVALPAGFELAGIVGLFAAVPVTAVFLAVATATRRDRGTRPSPGASRPRARLARPGGAVELAGAGRDRPRRGRRRGCHGHAAGVDPRPHRDDPCRHARTAGPGTRPPRPYPRPVSRHRGRWRLPGDHRRARARHDIARAAGRRNRRPDDGRRRLRECRPRRTAGPWRRRSGRRCEPGSSRHLSPSPTNVATLAAITVLSALLAFYFLRDGGRLWGRVIARVRPDAAAAVGAAGTRAFDVLGGYMIGTAAISFVGAASQFVIMVVLGLPLALPVFVLSFFLCFIPYIGGFISTGVAFLITIAAGSTADVVIMAIWTIVFNLVQGNIVSPLVYGRTVHIHPAIVLVAIPAGSAVAGILGMFIVVPVIGVVAATWRTVLAVMGERDVAPGRGQAPPPSTDVATPVSMAPTVAGLGP